MTLEELKLRITVHEQNTICIYRKNTLEETKENLINRLIIAENEDFTEYGESADIIKAECLHNLKSSITLLEKIDENLFKEYILKLEIEE